MQDLRFAFRQLLKNPGFTAVAVLTLTLGIGANTPALAHPGSGIVVDRKGQVYFTDTGHGVWKVDEQGRLRAHEGPAYQWMAIDHDGSLTRTRGLASREPSADLQRVGTDPTLLLSSDFPLTTGPDGSLYYPELGEDDRLRVHRLTPSGERSVLATLATTSDGQPLKWLNGMAASPGGVVYFTENSAVRRITPQGEVSTLASNIRVDNCQPPPGASPRLGSFLRGLDVASDGSVYVAASGCCALLKLTPQGQVTPVLQAVSPWSPTGAVVFVLEYLHTESGDRRDWRPRIRKLSPDGTAKVVAAVERIPGGRSRPVPVPGAKAKE